MKSCIRCSIDIKMRRLRGGANIVEAIRLPGSLDYLCGDCALCLFESEKLVKNTLEVRRPICKVCSIAYISIPNCQHCANCGNAIPFGAEICECGTHSLQG